MRAAGCTLVYHRCGPRPMSTPLMACPEGWVASPNASFSASCYYLSRPNSGEFTTSARGCTELCAERAGATTLGSSVPVCYTSAEEMGWIQEAWGAQYMCLAPEKLPARGRTPVPPSGRPRG